MFLNATKPPFDDVDARRAVAYALDREHWRAAAASCPDRSPASSSRPDFPGLPAYCPFTLGGGADGNWAGPDVATAEALVRSPGPEGPRSCSSQALTSPFQHVARKVVRQLRRLGYRVSRW